MCSLNLNEWFKHFMCVNELFCVTFIEIILYNVKSGCLHPSKAFYSFDKLVIHCSKVLFILYFIIHNFICTFVFIMRTFHLKSLYSFLSFYLFKSTLKYKTCYLLRIFKNIIIIVV